MAKLVLGTEAMHTVVQADMSRSVEEIYLC